MRISIMNKYIVSFEYTTYFYYYKDSKIQRESFLIKKTWCIINKRNLEGTLCVI